MESSGALRCQLFRTHKVQATTFGTCLKAFNRDGQLLKGSKESGSRPWNGESFRGNETDAAIGPEPAARSFLSALPLQVTLLNISAPLGAGHCNVWHYSRHFPHGSAPYLAYRSSQQLGSSHIGKLANHVRAREPKPHTTVPLQRTELETPHPTRPANWLLSFIHDLGSAAKGTPNSPGDIDHLSELHILWGLTGLTHRDRRRAAHNREALVLISP